MVMIMENTNMKKAALEYAEKGIPVFPVVPNNKKPLTECGFKDASTDPIVINLWWDKHPDANIGIPTGKVSGWFVVDVDIKEGALGKESLAELIAQYGKLPDTRQHVTPSGGYHLIFKYPGYYVPGSAGKLGSGIDIRSDGGYIVAPPSVIDGNCYQVINQCVAVEEAPEWLINLAVEKKKSAEGIKKGAETGGRNNHIFQTAMECNQQNTPYDEAAKVVLEANQQFTTPLDDKEVQRTLDSAYKYETSIVPIEIEEFNKTHAAIKIGSNCYILNEITCPMFNRPDFELLNVKGFKDFYCNRYMEIDGKKKNLGDAWFSHPKRRQYDGLTFNPKQTPAGYYNVWRGFAVEPRKGDCSLFLKHIEENIANDDKEVYDYIISWMAHTVQHPDILVGVAIVMKGSMGVGKGVFAEQFGKLFGRHYMLLNDSNQLVGKFNGHMKDKCLLFADEAFWAGDKTAEGKLKSMITESTINVEMKGKDAYPIKNNLHIIFATNNEWAAPAGPRDRRFFVIQVGEKHLQDIPYFKAVCDQMDNGGREALLHYLMNYDVSDMDLRKYPQTAALREAKLLSSTPAQKYWYHILETGCLHDSIEDGWGEGVVRTDYLYDKYIEFVNNMGIKHKATDTELGMQLKKMLPVDGFKKERKTVNEYKGTSRKNCYEFPSLAKCRNAFELFENSTFEWPAE
jgi:hypothetical protein